MKKAISSIICLILIFIVSIFMKNNNKSDLTKVKVAEVTHSVFYAPQYLADSLGFFKDEGLDVEIILTNGADAVAASVMSGDVNIGLCGSEQTIYTYNRGADDYLVNFSALTKKDGSFLIARSKNDNFKIEDLKGTHIIAGRKGGMPAMTLQYVLNQKGISLDDINFDTSIAFAAMSGSFISGNGDYVSLFEPNALALEKEGKGFVVASLGELGGTVPYTAYNSKLSYIKDNPEIIESFTKAIDRALEYVKVHSEYDIADAITSYFPDVSYDDLVKIIKRYMDIDPWYSSSFINEEDFNHIEDIMENANELEKRAPYDKLVDTTYMKHE